MRALTSCLLFCLLFVLACGDRESPPPESAPALVDPVADPVAAPAGDDSPACVDPVTARVVDGDEVEVAPDLGLGVARLAWREDLDGDGRDDLALRFPEACGSYGDCPYAVLAACDETRFTMVWGPEYCVEVDPGDGGDGGGEGWAELVAVDRQGDQGVRRVWRFEDGRYRRADLP